MRRLTMASLTALVAVLTVAVPPAHAAAATTLSMTSIFMSPSSSGQQTVRIGGDNTSTANGATASGTVTLRFQADVGISFAGLYAGSDVSTLKVSVTNTGPDTALHTRLLVTGLDTSLGLPPGCQASGTNVQCSLGDVPKGPNGQSIDVPKCSVFTAVDVVVTTDSYDPNKGNDARHIPGLTYAYGCTSPVGTSGGGGTGGAVSPASASPPSEAAPSPSAVSESSVATPDANTSVETAPALAAADVAPTARINWIIRIALAMVGGALGTWWWRRRQRLRTAGSVPPDEADPPQI